MKNSPGCTFDEIYSTFLKNHRTYDEWRAKLEKGDTALMTHLDSLENGYEGSFYQKIWAAMRVADLHNQRRIYEAMPFIFDNTTCYR